MEMISPNQYIERKKEQLIEELTKEKTELEHKINKIKEEINNNVPDLFNGGRDTKLQMYQLYCSELNNLIEKINNL